jgi:hypothetical protein
MTHDDQAFTAALRERVRDEEPDLDQLIQVSTRTGTRLRRRRTAGISIAGVAAGIAVIGIVGASLGGSGGSAGSEPGFATQPTATASATPPDVLPTLADMDRSRADELRELTLPLNNMDQPRAQQLPVHVTPSLKGWAIGTPADEKFPASKGDYYLGVVVRPMSDYAAWSGGDPDRPASQVAHVGENYFVTVQPNPDVPSAVVAELTGALRYDARWVKRTH